jgi:Uma2 family endonuclease
MATTVKRLTYFDLDTIPEQHEGDRHELIDGELVVTPSPAPRHQVIAKNLIFRLEQHIDERDLGTLIPAPIDVVLAPGDVLIPDVIFVRREERNAIGDRAIMSPPSLVIEILSPGTRRRDLNAKRLLYARYQVPEYWIVDPDARSVAVLSLIGGQYEEISHNADGTLRSLVLPDLILTVEAVFKGV